MVIKKVILQNIYVCHNASSTFLYYILDTNVIPDCLQNSSTMDDKGFDIEVVRGRVKDDKKSSTFNKLWNVDEQRRLVHEMGIFSLIGHKYEHRNHC